LDAENPAMTLQLTIDIPWRRVSDPARWPQHTTNIMSTQTIHGLGKVLRGLSVFFISLSVLIIAIPFSQILGTHTVRGVHTGDMRWLSWISTTLIFILIGVVLFCCYLISRREKRSLWLTGLLWGVVSIASAFGAFIVFEILCVIIQH